MNKTEIDKISLDLNRTVAPVLYIWIILGAAIVIENFLIIYLIIKWKPMHNICQCILANLAAADGLFGLCLIVTGVKDLYANFNEKPITETHLNCLLIVFPPLLSTTVAHCLTVAISFDRFLAAHSPGFYRNLTKSYAIVTNIACWFYGTVHSCLIFYTYSELILLPICHHNTTVNLFYNKLNGIFGVIWSILVIVLYSKTFVTVKTKMSRARIKNQSLPGVKSSVQFHIMKTLAVVVGIYVGCWLTKTIGTIVTSYTVDKNSLDIVGALFRVVNAVDAMSNFFVYYFMSSTFRTAFKIIVLKRRIQIVPSSASSSNPHNLSQASQSSQIRLTNF